MCLSRCLGGSGVRVVSPCMLHCCQRQEKKQRELLAHLPEHFLAVQKHYHLPVGDFPAVQRFREVGEVWSAPDRPLRVT